MPALRATTIIHCIVILDHWVRRAFACEGSQVNCFLLTVCLGGESEMRTLISCFTRSLALKILLQQKPGTKCYLLNCVTDFPVLHNFCIWTTWTNAISPLLRLQNDRTTLTFNKVLVFELKLAPWWRQIWYTILQQRSTADPSVVGKPDAVLVQVQQSSEGEDVTKAQDPWSSWWKVA